MAGRRHDVRVSQSLVNLDVPSATRSTPPGWRDPRLWIGVAIVAASVLVGVKVLASADESVQVWAVADDAAAGAVVALDDLEAVRIRFVDAVDSARYFLVEDALPTDARLVREVGAGELLPQAAVGAGADTGILRVSVLVPPGGVDPEIGPGARVDVWVTDDQGTASRPVLEDVVVLSRPSLESSFGAAGGEVQLVLGVPDADADALSEVLAAAMADRIHVLGRG